MTVRKVMVTVGMDHANPADLYGTLSHAGQTAVPNHLTGAPGGFTNTYDDLPDGTPSPCPIVPSDGPATLQNFVGLAGGRAVDVEREGQRFHPDGDGDDADPDGLAAAQPLNPLDYTNLISLAANGSYYGYVDVPDDATNLNIAVSYSGAAGRWAYT